MPAGISVRLDQLRQATRRTEYRIIRKDDSERALSDMLACAKHRMAEAEGFGLVREHDFDRAIVAKREWVEGVGQVVDSSRAQLIRTFRVLAVIGLDRGFRRVIYKDHPRDPDVTCFVDRKLDERHVDDGRRLLRRSLHGR